MPIDSSVAELITAQLFVLVQEAPEPIYFYINSTGIAVRQGRFFCGLCQQYRARGKYRDPWAVQSSTAVMQYDRRGHCKQHRASSSRAVSVVQEEQCST
jgi:hypothetical protein